MKPLKLRDEIIYKKADIKTIALIEIIEYISPDRHGGLNAIFRLDQIQLSMILHYYCRGKLL